MTHEHDITHAHDWRPHPTANARYRCTECGAIGYKPKPRGDEHHRATDGSGVAPYSCDARVDGKPCGKPATGHDAKDSPGGSRNFHWRCKEHRL